MTEPLTDAELDEALADIAAGWIPVCSGQTLAQLIADLRAARADRDHWREARRISQEYAEEFKARLDAVIALCDVHPTRNRVLADRCDKIRAAATRETK